MEQAYYATEYRDDEGRWVEWHTDERPLDADRAYERIRAMRPARAIQLVRKQRLAREE